VQATHPPAYACAALTLPQLYAFTLFSQQSSHMQCTAHSPRLVEGTLRTTETQKAQSDASTHATMHHGRPAVQETAMRTPRGGASRKFFRDRNSSMNCLKSAAICHVSKVGGPPVGSAEKKQI
jgi:hypothetical protein